MVRMGCAAVVAILFLLIAIPIFASPYLPWWGTLLLVFGQLLVLIFAGPKLIGYAIKRFAVGLFMTKSRVLRGAKAQVHEVASTHKPVSRVERGEWDDDQTPRLGSEIDAELIDPEPAEADETAEVDHSRYVRIVFTLTPKPGQSRMAYYDPSEIMLIPYDTKVSMDEDPTAEEQAAHAYEVKMFDRDGAVIEADKVTGETRLEIVFSCPTSLFGRVKFRYYFESFGDLQLP